MPAEALRFRRSRSIEARSPYSRGEYASGGTPLEVFGHHAVNHIEGLLEDIQLQRLIDAVDIQHAGGDTAALKALAGEDVGISAAAGDHIVRLDAFGLQGLQIQLIEEAFRVGLAAG